MNLQEYKDQTQDRLGIPLGDSSLVSPSLTRAINGALRHIASSGNWPWLIVEDVVVVPPGSSFTPPATWVRTLYVSDEDRSYTLAHLSDVTGTDSSFYGPAGRKLYAPRGAQIVLSPELSVETTIYHGYYRSEKVLVGSTDAPFTPDDHAEWVISEAAVRMAIRSGNDERLVQLREEAAVAKRAALQNARRSLGLPSVRRTRHSIWPGN